MRSRACTRGRLRPRPSRRLRPSRRRRRADGALELRRRRDAALRARRADERLPPRRQRRAHHGVGGAAAACCARSLAKAHTASTSWPRRGLPSTRGACRPQRRSAPRRSCVRSTRTSPRTARPADMCRAAGRPPLPRRPHAQAAHGPVRVKGTVTTVFTCSSFQFVLHVLSKPKVVHGHVHGSSPDLDSPSGRLCPEG